MAPYIRIISMGVMRCDVANYKIVLHVPACAYYYIAIGLSRRERNHQNVDENSMIYTNNMGCVLGLTLPQMRLNLMGGCGKE